MYRAKAQRGALRTRCYYRNSGIEGTFEQVPASMQQWALRGEHVGEMWRKGKNSHSPLSGDKEKD